MSPGAGAAYLSGGRLGIWEFAFTAAVTFCAYNGRGFIYVNTPGGVYECAVDVNSPSGAFEYMMLGGLDPTMFTNISSLSDGYHELARTPASGAIDYPRSPFVNQAKGCLALILSVWNSIFGNNQKVWTVNAGDGALNKLKNMITTSQRLYVFGAPYTYGGDGVHDIQMNQGDPLAVNGTRPMEYGRTVA